MPSTVIRRFDYSPEREELVVEFVSPVLSGCRRQAAEGGRRYLYSAVPQEEVEAMRRAFAKGSYFNKRIRDRYACRELV